MASIFKPPYISSDELATLLVENGEIVYNTDDNKFYTGNGTLGGKPLASDSVYTGNAVTIDFGDRTGPDAATRIEYGDRI